MPKPKGRTPVEKTTSCPDGQLTDITIPLPDNGTLVGATIGAEASVGPCYARLAYVAGNTRIILVLNHGYTMTYGGRILPLMWHGAVKMDPSYGNQLEGLIYNYTGSTIDFTVTAFMEDE